MELEYPAEMEQEQPVTSDSDYKSQIMEEAEVEAILLGNPTKAKEPSLPLIQTLEAEVEVEEAEEGEIPQIPMQQG